MVKQSSSANFIG